MSVDVIDVGLHGSANVAEHGHETSGMPTTLIIVASAGLLICLAVIAYMLYSAA